MRPWPSFIAPTFDDVSQTSHIAIAFGIVLAAKHWCNRPRSGFVVLVVFATLKEFVFDIMAEQDTWASSLWDFFCYVMAGAFTLLMIVLVPAWHERKRR